MSYSRIIIGTQSGPQNQERFAVINENLPPIKTKISGCIPLVVCRKPSEGVGKPAPPQQLLKIKIERGAVA